MTNLETRIMVNFSSVPTSDYQTLLKNGWIETEKATASNIFSFHDFRILERSEQAAQIEDDEVRTALSDEWNSLSKNDKKIRIQRRALKHRGYDC